MCTITLGDLGLYSGDNVRHMEERQRSLRQYCPGRYQQMERIGWKMGEDSQRRLQINLLHGADDVSSDVNGSSGFLDDRQVY